MKVEEWGYTNPVISYYYGKPPLVWKDMDISLIVFETEMENIRKVTPEPMIPRTNKVFVWTSKFDLGTTQGGFSETAVYVQVTHNGIEGDYEPFLYVNSPLPLTAGREIWGYQKKLADIQLIPDQEAIRGETTRLGHQIVKGLVVPERPATMDEIPWSSGGVFSLKYIPSAVEGGDPIRQLILTPGEFTAHDGKFFGGRASIRFEESALDPTYILKPNKIIGGFYGKGDLYLPLGKIVHEYK